MYLDKINQSFQNDSKNDNKHFSLKNAIRPTRYEKNKGNSGIIIEKSVDSEKQS